MRRIAYSSAFKKDHKRSVRRGLEMTKFDEVVKLLVNDTPLAKKFKPHMLSGEWKGFSECHIAPDWLLIYDLDDSEIVALHRMGTHADLFE